MQSILLFAKIVNRIKLWAISLIPKVYNLKDGVWMN